VAPGEYTFAVGTAGSATLVLQAVLPALLRAPAPSTLTLEGGTHNPMAPPYDFLAKAYLPLVRRMGVDVTSAIESRGFYPAGGGRFHVSVTPAPKLGRIDLLERGALVGRRVVATIANLPSQIAMREIETATRMLGWERSCFRTEVVKDTPGPGNIVTIELESEHVTEVFTGFGEKGVRAEEVAEKAVNEALTYIDAGVPVGEHLADQLVLPMALAGAGSFRTVPLSSHSTTHIGLLERILGARIRAEAVSEKEWHVEIGG
jgi:RNA 3'-terminal phosphate cyclase (ATP)